MTLKSFVLVVFLPAAPGLVSAHNVPFSYLDLSSREDGLRGELRMRAPDLAAHFSLSPMAVFNPAVLERNRARFASFLSQGLRLEGDGKPLAPELLAVEPVLEKESLLLRFEARWARPPRTLGVRCGVFPELPRHVTYVTLRRPGGGVESPVILDAANPSVEYRLGIYRSRLEAFAAFTRQGVHHIFIGPDHIAFILGLILLGGTLLRLAQIVTAFTLAHSVTLALACLGLLNPPARLIEPLIAMSIIFIGVENLRASPGRPDRRALIAFGFGFIHGFGFASVLREFGLPAGILGTALLAFNVGVELGQLAIVLCAIPLFARLRGREIGTSRAAVRFEALASCAIIAAGSYWLAQRMFWGA